MNIPENARELLVAWGAAEIAAPRWVYDLALRALDYEAASGEVTQEMVKRAIDAMSNRLGYVDSCFVRAALLAVAPLLSAAARRKALEEAASVAYTTPEYVAGWDSDGAMIPGSPYDRGRFDAAAAIRARKKESA